MEIIPAFLFTLFTSHLSNELEEVVGIMPFYGFSLLLCVVKIKMAESGSKQLNCLFGCPLVQLLLFILPIMGGHYLLAKTFHVLRSFFNFPFPLYYCRLMCLLFWLYVCDDNLLFSFQICPVFFLVIESIGSRCAGRVSSQIFSFHWDFISFKLGYLTFNFNT